MKRSPSADDVTGEPERGGSTAYVALGSNLGDREGFLARAAAALAATPGVEELVASRVYETRAVGPGSQPPYLNAVVRLRTRLGPRALLERLQAIEREAGRERGEGASPVRWGPRTLDLDLLLYDARCIEEPGLAVPHPRLQERAFVLEPLCDLAPEATHPRSGRRFDALARAVRDAQAVRPWPRRLREMRPVRAERARGSNAS